MAQKTSITFVDDIDGTEADETISFAYRGQNYMIDLSKPNAETFDQLMAPYIGAGRKTVAVVHKPRRTAARTDSADARAWLKTQPIGRDLPARGRIPSAMVRMWEDAGRPRPPSSPAFAQPRLS